MTPREEVLQHYPNAKPIKQGKGKIIVSDKLILGKGKNNRCAWLSSSRNL